MNDAIDAYTADMTAEGRFSASGRTEVAYRVTLYAHSEDVTNRDPRYVGVEDVKRTLARWPNPNTRSVNRAKLRSFYAWCVYEGIRKDNPVDATRPSRRRPSPYRHLNVAEMLAMLEATDGIRERRAVHLLLLAGLRRDELLGLQGRHFERAARVWVSGDIAKGGREREIPVLLDLERVADEIRVHVASAEYVLPKQRWRNPPKNTERADYASSPSSPQALTRLIARVAERAGVRGHVTAHCLRYSFADFIEGFCDVRTAQAVLGHASIATTERYLSAPRFDRLAEAMKGVTLGSITRTDVLGVAEIPRTDDKATTGFEPVFGSLVLLGTARPRSLDSANQRDRFLRVASRTPACALATSGSCRPPTPNDRNARKALAPRQPRLPIALPRQESPVGVGHSAPRSAQGASLVGGAEILVPVEEHVAPND